jgi:hypothetical protein
MQHSASLIRKIPNQHQKQTFFPARHVTMSGNRIALSPWL